MVPVPPLAAWFARLGRVGLTSSAGLAALLAVMALPSPIDSGRIDPGAIDPGAAEPGRSWLPSPAPVVPHPDAWPAPFDEGGPLVVEVTVVSPVRRVRRCGAAAWDAPDLPERARCLTLPPRSD